MYLKIKTMSMNISHVQAQISKLECRKKLNNQKKQNLMKLTKKKNKMNNQKRKKTFNNKINNRNLNVIIKIYEDLMDIDNINEGNKTRLKKQAIKTYKK